MVVGIAFLFLSKFGHRAQVPGQVNLLDDDEEEGEEETNFNGWNPDDDIIHHDEPTPENPKNEEEYKPRKIIYDNENIPL